MDLSTIGVALCVGGGVGALAAWWRGRSFTGWALGTAAVALFSPALAAVAGIVAVAMLPGDEDENKKQRDSGFSFSGFGDD
ncbi:hypothetical protein [Ramlibacter albus]|uniref:Uncharacterized protein n=1 Tax=Ramlibacter albus TaxID=2079448 RepID=A0A923MA61_9BURK|nr:hypothetical protein [Ramlibacter albus]MBC5765716.1 hypothetical protein [Ramlibacter albus]